MNERKEGWEREQSRWTDRGWEIRVCVCVVGVNDR